MLGMALSASASARATADVMRCTAIAVSSTASNITLLDGEPRSPKAGSHPLRSGLFDASSWRSSDAASMSFFFNRTLLQFTEYKIHVSTTGKASKPEAFVESMEARAEQGLLGPCPSADFASTSRLRAQFWDCRIVVWTREQLPRVRASTASGHRGRSAAVTQHEGGVAGGARRARQRLAFCWGCLSRRRLLELARRAVGRPGRWSAHWQQRRSVAAGRRWLAGNPGGWS